MDNEITITKGKQVTISFFFDNECYMVQAEYNGKMMVVEGTEYYQFKKIDSDKVYTMSKVKLKQALQQDLVDVEEFTL